ncbi:hypothetical protein [Scytonema hofmannii]|uniref:hypothetical protein n=1 Tax=Scytonema hofmannii TaxID=34078 RepID=UPI00034DCD63|nr:hypothetical protein [Scytonema hofmannii]
MWKEKPQVHHLGYEQHKGVAVGTGVVLKPIANQKEELLALCNAFVGARTY